MEVAPARRDRMTQSDGESAGLSATEAAQRLLHDGPNEVAAAPGRSRWAMLLDQVRNPMVALLVLAAAVAGAAGEVLDAVAIGCIVVLNAVVGFVQEARSENALHALRSMTAPRARVVRDGQSAVVPAREVVVGDLLVLEAGDIVAADGKVVVSNLLRVDEAALTGESVPVDKDPSPVAAEAHLAERHDSVFAGTMVVNGTARVVVGGTGMATEIGRIAGLLGTAERGPTPLEERLAAVSRSLLWLSLAVVGLVALLGVVRGTPWLTVLLGAVSLAVAVVPEGLPSVVMIALAAGVQRMAKLKVLVRRLPAVETLGCTTVICTDKTGTLTTGHMRVRELWGPDELAILDAAVACNDAEVHEDGSVVGDPTEVALLIAGRERQIERAEIERLRPRVSAQPFDAERKRMSVLRSDGVLYVKGALSHLLPLLSGQLDGAEAAEAALAARGLRVLAVARGQGAEEQDLTLLGLVGIADPPRPEAVEAVAAARRAGIRTVMITGDHAVTAQAIARELGVLGADEDPEGIVHARVTPEDKIRIVRDWKARGAIVAMTGDGVNDAPAVREAHVGIAMGAGGTEVTREAASVVITDDNFASIIAGIREGRAIYDNIRKTIVYLLTGNAAELVVMLAAAAAGLPLPLVPIQLLWINLVTDGLPALALVTESPDAHIMDRPPRDPQEPVLARREWFAIGAFGALEALVVLAVYAWGLEVHDEKLARTLAFDTLVASELTRAFAARSTRLVFWKLGPFTNRALLGVVALSATVQVLMHLHPAPRAFLHLHLLGIEQVGLVVLAGLIPVTTQELVKLGRAWRRSAS
jgi:Ca2+-transporting ATPase